MKTLALILWLASVGTAFGVQEDPAHRGSGDGTRGGGAQLEAAFRLRATELIQSVSNSTEAAQLCPAEALRTGLDATQILIVDELTDPETGKPIAGRKLDAWANPGQLQLLRSAWTAYLDPFQSNPAKSVDALILHELYRTTSGHCNDDDFRLSRQAMGYLRLPSKFAQIFAFMGTQPAVRLLNTDMEQTHYTYCDVTPDLGATLTCAFLWPRSIQQPELDLRIVRGTVEVIGGDPVLREKFSLNVRPLSREESRQLLNLLAFVAAERPFYLVFDLQFARWAYGYDLQNLINLP